jgi:hypothetical protein
MGQPATEQPHGLTGFTPAYIPPWDNGHSILPPGSCTAVSHTLEEVSVVLTYNPPSTDANVSTNVLDHPHHSIMSVTWRSIV